MDIDDNNVLHVYNDNSRLVLISVKKLIMIPIWKGNRTIDMKHVEALKMCIEDIRSLDKGYSVVIYNEKDAMGRDVSQSYVLDGQHRLSILRDYYFQNPNADDFVATCCILEVQSENDAIQCFNRVNMLKPIKFSEDPVLVANRFICETEKIFSVVSGRRLVSYIKPLNTSRPYLSADKLRDALVPRSEELSKLSLARFTEKIIQINNDVIMKLKEGLLAGTVKDVGVAQRCLNIGFGLGYDMRLKWVAEL
jgi:hypothetical protein